MKLNKILFAILLILATTAGINGLNAQAQSDRILAIVGNDVILESDFQYQLQLYARQNQLTEITPMIAQQVFQQILTDKIIYAKAVQDSIEISEDDINRELDFRIKSLIEQVGSARQLEEIYGMSLGRIRLLLREELEKKLRADRLKRDKFRGGIKVSDKEIREFFETYRDSLPASSNEYEISQIFITRKISDAEKTIARQKAQDLLDSIRLGVSFEELATRHSEDPGSKVNGGYLGPAGKNVYVPAFEEALFSMSIGEVSDPVETEFGYHIIKLEDIQGDTRTARHILITFPRLESSDFESITFLNDLKSRIERGDITFEEAAMEYSQATESKRDSGYVGFVPTSSLDSAELEAVEIVQTGGITEPIRVGGDQSYGYELLKVHRFIPEHELSLSDPDDYEKVKRFALYFKENKELEEWLDELRETIYVDIRF